MNRITYGPFLVRMDLLAVALACLIGAPLLIGFGASMTRIHCERRAALSCTMWTWSFKTSSQDFTPVSAHTTYSRRIYKGRPSEYGRVVVTDNRGREHSSIEVDHAESSRRAAELQTFLQNPRASEIGFTLHESWLLLGLGVFSVFLVIVMGKAAFRGAGRVHLQFSEDHLKLIARRSFWGLPLSTRHIDIVGAKAVTIEWKAIPVPMGRSYTPPEAAGRICIQTSRGTQALLGAFARGRNTHLAVAKELRMQLGLSAVEGETAPPCPGHDWWSNPMGRFSACWMGICVGMLAGMALGCSPPCPWAACGSPMEREGPGSGAASRWASPEASHRLST